MKSIRANLLKTFLIIITILSLVNLLLFVLNLRMVQQYKSISDIMVAEYKLAENSTKLIDAYNTRVQSAGTDEADSQARIDEANAEIKELTLYLDGAIDDTHSLSDYFGFKASIEKFTKHINDSLIRFEQSSIKDYFTDYNEANKIYGFVRDNGTSLIFTQLQYTTSIQDAIDQTYLIGVITSIGILVLFIIACIFLSFRFSNKLTIPIKSLDTVAQKIAKGNKDIIIDDELLTRDDEIGSLSRSYKIMIGQLFQNITELGTANKNIEEAKKKVEELVIERTKDLNREKARLLASINSLSFGFIIADMDHNVLLANKAMTDLFDAKDTEIMSIDHISEFLGENSNIKTKVELCLKDKKVCEIKEINFGPIFLRGIIAPIVTEDQMIGYVFLLEDITEARTIDKTKTEFVSLASHQLRTPLSAINWYTEMLLSGDAGELNSEQKNFLEEVITSSKRMSSLVGTLLDVSRIELGTFAVNPERVDLRQLIENEVEDLKLQIAEKEIIFKLFFDLDPAVVSVDPKLMSIAIQNFLTNSIKYSSIGGKVTLLVEEDKELGGVTVSVKDDGFGIPKEAQSKIFTKMYRADNAKVSDATGNGLGLYMVKSILESSGCKVWFESPPKDQKEGTVFYIHIPKEGMTLVKAAKRIGEPMS